MLSLLSQSNRLKKNFGRLLNVLYKIQMAITYTGIHYNGYLSSSPLSMLSQHHRVWTSHVGLHKQWMAEVDIFPRSSSTLREGGGRVAARLFGQRQLLVHCRHHKLSTFSQLCIDISCKLYSQQLVKWRHARRSHDWQLTSEEGCCCRLTGCVVTQLLDYDGVYHCLERNMPNTTCWH